MIYLDYSATTPVSKEVLESFQKACINYIGNPNSLHKLGVEAHQLIDQATDQIAKLLNIKANEIIYTSGASEANNLALKGIAMKYKNRGNHIITTPLEHASILEPLHYLEQFGFEVSYVKLTKTGEVDLEDLKTLLRDTTILVSIASVSSELGICQPIEEIGMILKQYPKCYFHVDVTQSIGKVPISLNCVDLASFSAHKFYGLKGIGCLLKRGNIQLEPLIHGGESTTIDRSGTPALPLIVSLSKALRLALEPLDEHAIYVKTLHDQFLSKLDSEIIINSTSSSIPHIINFSVPVIKPETFMHALEEHEIYVSTKSACSSKKAVSSAVLALTHDEAKARSSIRISLSHLTTSEEIDFVCTKINEIYHHFKEVSK